LKSEFVVKYECASLQKNYFIDKDYEKYLSKKISLSSDHSVMDPNRPFLLHIQMELCWKTIREAIKQLYNELNYLQLIQTKVCELCFELKIKL
jgi:hypothetical protein